MLLWLALASALPLPVASPTLLRAGALLPALQACADDDAAPEVLLVVSPDQPISEGDVNARRACVREALLGAGVVDDSFLSVYRPVPRVPPVYRGSPITLVADGEVGDVVRAIGGAVGRAVVVDDDVAGHVRLQLVDVPWDQALARVLEGTGVGTETRRGVLRFARQTTLHAERERRVQAQTCSEKRSPPTLRLIPVAHADVAGLSPAVRRLLSSQGRVAFDAERREILVEDHRDTLDEIERLVRRVDVPHRRVHLAARVLADGALQDVAALDAVQIGDLRVVAQAGAGGFLLLLDGPSSPLWVEDGQVAVVVAHDGALALEPRLAEDTP